MRYLTTTCLAVFVVLLMLAAPAAAQPIEDTFWAEVDAAGVVVGGGSGYDGDGDGEGDWYHYPNTGWWNEWFYDHPYDPTRWKKIDVAFNIVPIDTSQASWAEITFNWSLPPFSPSPELPPLPPLTPEEEEAWITRAEPYIFEGEVPVLGACIIDSIEILDYNPEWISIDIMGYNYEILNGCINHECIPEPATMALLGLGGLAVLVRRRRKA